MVLARRGYLATRPTYPGLITLFRAINQPAGSGLGYDDPQNGWGSVALQGVRVIPIPASHLTMFHEPGISAMADSLQLALDDETPEGRRCAESRM